MTWGVCAAGAIAVAGTVMSNASASAQASQMNTQAYNQYTNNVKSTMERNQAIEQANTTNMIRAGYQASIIQLQTARLKEQAATAGWQASEKGVMALSNVEANSAAAGNVGASVNAVANDVKKKSAEAQISVQKQWYQMAENQNFQMDALIMQSQDAQKSPESIPEIGTVNTVTAPQKDPLVAGVAGALGAYASSKFSLGTGGSSGGDGFVAIPMNSAGNQGSPG